MDNQQIIQAITTQGILPLYYHDDATVTLEVAKALYQAGIHFVQ